ncbi:MAG: hypothetical protein ACREGF_00155 [Candidatus Saccharimonadales bacterium]
MVQYTVHPTTGFVYGSEPGDYRAKYNLLATISDSVAPLRKLPFKQFNQIAVVCEPEEWQKRFDSRSAEMDKADIGKRLHEAGQSLAWSLGQEKIHWVVNTQDRLSDAAQDIIEIARQNSEPYSIGQQTALNLQTYLDFKH